MNQKDCSGKTLKPWPVFVDHTIATHMMKSPDRNLQAVKKLLGYVSIQSTLEYIDDNVDSLRDILEKELM